MLNIDISCPFCGEPVESGKPPGTAASKYAKRGPYYLCPHCSQPIELNDILGSGKSFLAISLGTATFGCLYLAIIVHYQINIGIANLGFIIGIVFIGLISRRYTPKRVRWIKRDSEL